MGQVKVYGLADNLNPIKSELPCIIHGCIVEALAYPPNKKFHRFFPMAKEDFYFPDDRTEAYTIIEISIFQGRTVEAKKHLIQLLFQKIHQELGISPQDLEITMFETPKGNWGIRGLPGDKLHLNYKLEI